MKKVIILAIPGIGRKKQGFSKPLQSDIEKYAKNTPLENAWELVEAIPFKIAKVDENQDLLYERLQKHNRLEGIFSFRRFVLDAFGDGVTFDNGADKPGSVYFAVHSYLREKVQEINRLQRENPGAKMVIVAASMGVHLLCTYIWDADHNRGIFKEQPAGENENLRNLNFLFTIGCNLPLFYSGLHPDHIVPIDKNRRAPDFGWYNYYDKDDVLGWPLAAINDAFGAMVEDFEINAGIYVEAHLNYWKDKDFTKPFVQKLNSIIL